MLACFGQSCAITTNDAVSAITILYERHCYLFRVPVVSLFQLLMRPSHSPEVALESARKENNNRKAKSERRNQRNGPLFALSLRRLAIRIAPPPHPPLQPCGRCDAAPCTQRRAQGRTPRRHCDTPPPPQRSGVTVCERHRAEGDESRCRHRHCSMHMHTPGRTPRWLPLLLRAAPERDACRPARAVTAQRMTTEERRGMALMQRQQRVVPVRMAPLRSATHRHRRPAQWHPHPLPPPVTAGRRCHRTTAHWISTTARCALCDDCRPRRFRLVCGTQRQQRRPPHPHPHPQQKPPRTNRQRRPAQL